LELCEEEGRFPFYGPDEPQHRPGEKGKRGNRLEKSNKKGDLSTFQEGGASPIMTPLPRK